MSYYISAYSGADGRGPIVSKGSFSTKAEAQRYAKALRKEYPYSSPIVLKAGKATKRRNPRAVSFPVGRFVKVEKVRVRRGGGIDIVYRRSR